MLAKREVTGGMHLDRYHGLGNDYLVKASGPPLGADSVVALCDRHTGVGGDGILEPFDTDRADHGVTIWNPDGSIAEKSGNGLRIFAQWLVDEGVAADRAFTVWTGACLVSCEVGDDVVTVQMGRASFEPADVPVLAEGPVLDGAIVGKNHTWSACAVGVGNPHCVVFVDEELDALPWAAWGEELEVHPRFPRRTNVQVARVLAPDRIAIRIWERGAGITAASGSSSCAVVAAALRTGRVPPGTVRVCMPGGDVHVAVTIGFDLTLVGPVERIGRMTVAPAWWARRGF